jgi:vacuolar protein-sorting-associated protein 4
LPEVEAREYFLKMQMKKTPHNLSEQDFTELSKRTVNYSGADLAILCKDAAMEPLRVAQRSNRFRKLPNGKFIAAGPNEMGHDIQTMGLYDLPDNGLELDPIERVSFEAALLRTKPTVALPDLIEFEKWTADFGQDGGD